VVISQFLPALDEVSVKRFNLLCETVVTVSPLTISTAAMTAARPL
jgi:hypothetical protein